MSPADTPALVTAQRFYGVHRAEHLARDADRLIDRCASHLVETHGMTTAGAREVAQLAAEQIERGTVSAVVDLARSDATGVVVRDLVDNSTHYLAAGELLQMARSNKPTAPAAAPATE